MTANNDALATSVDPRQAGGGLRLTYLVVAIVAFVLLFVQPILIGVALDDNHGAWQAHKIVGMAVVTVGVLQVLAALLWWKPGRGPVAAFGVSVVLLVLELAQFAIGELGNATLHVPLGIVILFGAASAVMMPLRRSKTAA